MGRWSGKACRLSAMMLLTSAFFLVEIVVGYVTNSIALVADSFHMLSDLVALVVGLASLKIAKKRTKGNTYGWQRAEVLGALINCIFLMALCFSILVESLKRLVELEPVENPVMMLVVGGLGLLVNLLGLALFGGHGHSHGAGDEHCHDIKIIGQDCTMEKEVEEGLCGNGRPDIGRKAGVDSDLAETECLVDALEKSYLETTTVIVSDDCPNNNHVNNNNIINNINNNNSKNKRNGATGQCVHHNNKECDHVGDNVVMEMEKPAISESINMRGVFLHVLGDALGSVVVIVSGLAIWLVEGHWKYYLDPVLSLIIVGIILYTTIPLFRETAHILLQAVPPGVCVEGITTQLLAIDGVTAVTECHVWRLSGRRIIASAHVHCKDLSHYFNAAPKIKDVFHRAGISSTTIQPEIDKPSHDVSDNSIQHPTRDQNSNGDSLCRDKTVITP